jgi:hypothetical protein
MRQGRGNFQADITVTARRLLVKRAKEIRGLLDIFDRQVRVDLLSTFPG